MNKMPAKFVRLLQHADKCVKALIREGIDANTAQDIVLEIIKESEDEISRGDTQGVTNALTLTFLK